jgi:ribonuclease HI
MLLMIFGQVISLIRHNEFPILGEDQLKRRLNIPPDGQMIYTDGACSANGTIRSQGGIGIIYGPNRWHDLSGSLPGPQQTNQRAEIFEIAKSLQMIYWLGFPGKVYYIASDSRYAIGGITLWSQKWERVKLAACKWKLTRI